MKFNEPCLRMFCGVSIARSREEWFERPEAQGLDIFAPHSYVHAMCHVVLCDYAGLVVNDLFVSPLKVGIFMVQCVPHSLHCVLH